MRSSRIGAKDMNTRVLTLGLAYYNGGLIYVRKLAKTYCKEVSASNRKVLKQLMSANDNDLCEIMEIAIKDTLELNRELNENNNI